MKETGLLSLLLGIINSGSSDPLFLLASVSAGIASFLLLEKNKTMIGFFSEVFISFFAGFFLGKAVSEQLQLSENTSVALTAIIAFSGRQLLIIIRKKLPEGIVDSFIKLIGKHE